MTHLISKQELAFQLYEVLDAASLTDDPRYAHHSRETFDGIIEASRDIATRYFAPHHASGDGEEPRFEDGRARVSPHNAEAWRAFANAGFLNAHWSEAEGGLAVPEVILRAAMASFYTANVAATAYPLLTIAAANLLRSFGSAELKARYLPLMASGHLAGTMALTEPDQGSSLGDIRTQAVTVGDGTFLVKGQKTFISGGDQDITPNILHLVLARIQGAPAGAKGVSLFAVPRLLDGKSNDVTLVGLIKKMGWRNSTSAALSRPAAASDSRGGRRRSMASTCWAGRSAMRGPRRSIDCASESCMTVRRFPREMTKPAN